jgi:tetratricopeptide (TPR) repeat protein
MADSDRTLGSDRTFGAPTNAGDSHTLPPPEDAPITLEIGTVLAGRYQIIDLLGIGGMGAVYKAFDRQLTRVVALKTILAEMAATPTAMKRFKSEVVLAQSIVHKNIVRIFDIGEDGDTKFITMDFIEGADLKHLIVERGKLPPLEAAGIIRQVCSGLEAAHAAGVIHRDLKPQNIMMQSNGQVIVMDFGIAGSGQSRGATQTGAFLGTPDYMSPEQAQTEPSDARSDIFSLGLIFYEMLTGKLPFRGKTVLETMFKRTTEAAVAPVEIDPSLPKSANDIVVKCLQRDPEQRYQSVTALLEDLETFDPTKKVGAADRAKVRLKKAAPYRNIGAVAALVLVALVAGYMLRNRFAPPKPPAAHAPMTVVIADFSNHTGDPVFDGTLEPVVKLALEGASFISAYDRTKMRDLGMPAVAKLDEAKAQEIATNQGLNIVVAGSLDRRGTEYQLSLRAIQAVTGQVVANSGETAPGKDQVLFALTKLGTTVRKALGDSTSESDQRLSMETLSAASVDAVHQYAAGLDALSRGNFEEAVSQASQAVALDPNFGMAYTLMASASRNMGRLQDAEKNAREAIRHTLNMTERERYRSRAYLYLLTGDQQKCVDEYGSLLARYPSDTGSYTNIGVCYLHLHQVPKALEAAEKAIAILPRRAGYHANLAYFSVYTGDFQKGAREAAEAQKLGYTTGLLFEAYVALAQERVQAADEAYRKFAMTNPSEGTTGLGDLAWYEGRFKDAVGILEKGAEADMAPPKPSPDAASTKLWMLAYVQLLRGEKASALAAAKRSLDLSKAVQTRFMTGRTYVALGETDKAKDLIKSLASELETEPQAYAKLLEGELALQSGDARTALNLFNQGNQLLDTWIGRFDLGRAELELKEFPEADSEFDRCITRRGEVMALFLDLPTYGLFPEVYYYQGLVREGEKAQGFQESYKKYLNIRGKAGEDRLLPDVRKRAGI